MLNAINQFFDHGGRYRTFRAGSPHAVEQFFTVEFFACAITFDNKRGNQDWAFIGGVPLVTLGTFPARRIPPWAS